MQKSNFLLTLTLLAMSIWTNAAFAEPAITGASATGTTIKFTVQLSEKLFSGYKVKIDLQNGKGLAAMSCSASTLICTLSSSVLPKGVGDASYSVGIYDSKGALQGEAVDSSYVITATAEVNAIPTAPPVITVPTIPPVNTAPSSATGYTKISNSGATLPATAQLGANPNDWACTKDNKTGLIWEVKTTDGGVQDWKSTYSWYEPDAKKNGDGAGYQNLGTCKGSNCDTYAFTKAVNAKGLCGKKDWRMPTKDELVKLVVCSDGKDAYGSCTKNYKTVTSPTINTTYFPNTPSTWFWSSSPYASSSSLAWSVHFSNGSSYNDFKGFMNDVRLVRG